MVDHHAARTSEQPSEIGEKHSWVSKFVIFGVLTAIIAVLVLLA
jgi:hypothetical protein